MAEGAISKPERYIYIAIFIGVLAVEKILVWHWLQVKQPAVFINTNGIFNLPLYNHLAVGLLLLALVWLWTKSQTSVIMVTGLSLLWLGGLSNLIDRWLYGGVVDYWHIWQLAFNLADTAIILGALLITITLIKRPK